MSASRASTPELSSAKSTRNVACAVSAALDLPHTWVAPITTRITAAAVIGTRSEGSTAQPRWTLCSAPRRGHPQPVGGGRGEGAGESTGRSMVASCVMDDQPHPRTHLVRCLSYARTTSGFVSGNGRRRVRRGPFGRRVGAPRAYLPMDGTSRSRRCPRQPERLLMKICSPKLSIRGRPHCRRSIPWC